MKNYYKTVSFLAGLYLAAVIVFAVLTGRSNGEIPGRDSDIIKLNDIAGDAAASWGSLEELGKTDHGVDYVVLDAVGNLVYASYPVKADVSLSSAMKKGSMYSCVTLDDRVLGYVILKDDGSNLNDMRIRILAGLCVFGVLLFVSAFLFGKYVQKNIIVPFENMKEFAGNIAEGNLDAPLVMDKNNMFGAFTESFDLMREELSASKKREIELQRRERELVASLSHDLKTPITGIKVTTELLKARLGDSPSTFLESGDVSPDSHDTFLQKLDNIYKKADQIDVLVSDLFSSTMEDLDELKVRCTDERSAILGDIVRKYDDRELAVQEDLPDVLIHIDAKRMSQVIGNIISNSYKYANTKIEIGCRLVDDYLEMSIRDHGPGVPEDELLLITNKFYRGRQWADSGEEGSGLGLYIAKLLMEKMDGELIAACPGEGLEITLMIPLS